MLICERGRHIRDEALVRPRRAGIEVFGEISTVGENLPRGKFNRALQLAIKGTIVASKSWAEQACSYNELITSWLAIVEANHGMRHIGTQMELV